MPVLLGVNVVHARCAARAPRCPLPRTGRNRLDRGTTLLDPAPPAQRPQRSRSLKPQKQPDQEDEEAAARGVTCVPTMSSNGIHPPKPTLVFLDQQKRSSRTARPAVTNPRISV